MAKEKLTLPHYCDIAKHDTLPLNANMIYYIVKVGGKSFAETKEGGTF